MEIQGFPVHSLFSYVIGIFQKWYKEIKDKNTILLYSPACTSFDQYENYIKRCQEFDQLIREEGYV